MATILLFIAAFFLGCTAVIWLLFSICAKNSRGRPDPSEYVLLGLISLIPLSISFYTLILRIQIM